MAPQDQIWANEGGVIVRFVRGSAHREADVVISIIEQSTDHVLASATVTGWRWDRAVAAMTPEASLDGVIPRAAGFALTIPEFRNSYPAVAKLEDALKRYNAVVEG